MLKPIKRFIALAIVGPIVGLYTFFSKHWDINTAVAIALLFALPLPHPIPVLGLNFLIGYALCATILGVAQQVTAFIYNWRQDQCEMIGGPMVPEISYAAYRGIFQANAHYASAEAEDQVEESDGFYHQTTNDFLLATAGHFSCRGKCKIGRTWDLKEEKERESIFFGTSNRY